MLKQSKSFLTTLFLALLFAGCAGSYEVSEVSEKLANRWSNSVTTDSLPITSSLLDLFNDEALDTLVTEALKNNHNLKAAAYRLEASDYMLAQTRARLIPSLGAGISKSRNNLLIDPVSGKNQVNNKYNLSANISWEIDIWGKLYEAHSANVLDWEAQNQNFIAAQDALAARVIQTWVLVIAAGKDVELLTGKLSEVQNLNLSVNKKFRKGLAELDELNLADSELNLLTAELETAKTEYSIRIRELEILLGREPRTELVSSEQLPVIENAPVKIPATVIKERPDIKAALLRLQSAGKLASAAKKEMLPRLSISSDMFKESLTIGDVTGATLIWNVVGNLVQPIFEGGRLLNEAKAKSLERDATLFELHDLVYNALKEVEDALANENNLKVQEEKLNSSLNKISKNEIIYKQKYRKGLIHYSRLVDAVNQVSDTKIQLNRIKASRLSNRIVLALALGYGANKKNDAEKI